MEKKKTSQRNLRRFSVVRREPEKVTFRFVDRNASFYFFGTFRFADYTWIAIPVNQKKAYFSLCIIKYFLDIISPNNDMKAKIDALLSSYPSIDINAMGFPRGWENEPLWR